MKYIYKAVIKEVGNRNPLTPVLIGDKKTLQDLVDFWGLNEPDVEWYKIYQIIVDTQVEP